jgi:hypothetical protein
VSLFTFYLYCCSCWYIQNYSDIVRQISGFEDVSGANYFSFAMNSIGCSNYVGTTAMEKNNILFVADPVYSVDRIAESSEKDTLRKGDCNFPDVIDSSFAAASKKSSVSYYKELHGANVVAENPVNPSRQSVYIEKLSVDSLVQHAENFINEIEKAIKYSPDAISETLCVGDKLMAGSERPPCAKFADEDILLGAAPAVSQAIHLASGGAGAVMLGVCGNVKNPVSGSFSLCPSTR